MPFCGLFAAPTFAVIRAISPKKCVIIIRIRTTRIENPTAKGERAHDKLVDFWGLGGTGYDGGDVCLPVRRGQRGRAAGTNV